MTIFSRFLRFCPKTPAEQYFFHKNQQNPIILTNILYKNTYLLWLIQLNCSNVHFSVFANSSSRPKCSIKFQFISIQTNKFAKITKPCQTRFPFIQTKFKLFGTTGTSLSLLLTIIFGQFLGSEVKKQQKCVKLTWGVAIVTAERLLIWALPTPTKSNFFAHYSFYTS